MGHIDRARELLAKAHASAKAGYHAALHIHARVQRRLKPEVLAVLDHKHMIGTAYLNNPPLTEEEGARWLEELVAKVNMKVLMGPYTINCTTLGNEGVTGIICLETSHASFHCWPKVGQPFMKFDIYSCKDFTAQQVIEHMAVFDPVRVDYTMIDRNNDNDIFEIERGSV